MFFLRVFFYVGTTQFQTKKQTLMMVKHSWANQEMIRWEKFCLIRPRLCIAKRSLLITEVNRTEQHINTIFTTTLSFILQPKPANQLFKCDIDLVLSCCIQKCDSTVDCSPSLARLLLTDCPVPSEVTRQGLESRLARAVTGPGRV